MHTSALHFWMLCHFPKISPKMAILTFFLKIGHIHAIFVHSNQPTDTSENCKMKVLAPKTLFRMHKKLWCQRICFSLIFSISGEFFIEFRVFDENDNLPAGNENGSSLFQRNKHHLENLLFC